MRETAAVTPHLDIVAGGAGSSLHKDLSQQITHIRSPTQTQKTFDMRPTHGNQGLEAALAFYGSERQIELRWFRIYDARRAT